MWFDVSIILSDFLEKGSSTGNQTLNQYSMANKQGREEDQKKIMNKDDLEDGEIIKRSANEQEIKHDKGGKSTPNRKKPILDRLNTSMLIGDMKQDADVQIVSLSILCPGRPEIELSHPFISSPKACLFTLKEGTKYRLKFSFIVSNKIVSGLEYENTLWKSGVRVDRSTVMLGTFSPHEKPYGYQLEEETLPSGILVRGLYYARAKVKDDGGKCYMDIMYHFDIKKTWPSSP